METDKKYRDIHGTTRVGDFLRTLKRSDLVGKAIDLVGDVSSGGILKGLEGLLGKDEGLTPEQRAHALELVKLDIKDMEGVSSRWASDMNSDSWLSKNIRPVTLAFLTAVLTLLIIGDSLQWSFRVRDNWIDLLQTLLVSVYVAYFGGRSYEKSKRF